MHRKRHGFPAALRPVAAICLAALLPGQLLQAELPMGDNGLNSNGLGVKSSSGIPRIDTNSGETDPRILHLLNRFTFGATPADIAAVRELGNRGMERWFEQQLRPDRLPQTSSDLRLQSQLAALPALQLPVDQLLGTFPSGAIIRQAANGKFAVPQDPYLYAIYRRHIDLYEDKQAKKAEAQKKPEGSKPELAKNDAGTMSTQNGGKEAASDGGASHMAGGAGAENKPEPAVMEPAKTEPGKAESAKVESGKPDGPRAAPGKAPEPARPTYADLLVKSVLALPAAQRVHRILFMQPVEYEQFHSALKGPQKLQLIQDMTPSERELVTDFENPTRTVIEELETQRLLRDIYSSHQLQEVMTTFWLNHFNVFLHKNEETPYYLVSYERDVIRPNALGNFEDLLVATAESPAMLLYLDNSSSTGPDSQVAEKQKIRAAQGKAGKATPPGLNENYARELMELHTLGVNGGYTQKDVTEVAKVFTGWTVDHPQLGGGFEFDESRHEPGKKLVLGHKIKEHGQKEGLDLLHLLATSPATAHFISQELAVAFVSDDPPAGLVNRMAQEFEKSHGEISDVLRTMVRSPEFWAPATYQAKVKTPLEYVVSAARASGAEIVNPQPLVNALNQMGMPLYGCVPPTGYSLKADAWVSTGELVTRMNFALSLATNRFNGIKPQWTQPNQAPTSATQSEQDLEARLIPGGVSDKTRAAVLDQAQLDPQGSPKVQVFPPVAQPVDAQTTKPKPQNQNPQPTALEKQNAQIAGLLLGSPEFQRR